MISSRWAKGAEHESRTLTFSPGEINDGNYSSTIGTTESDTLGD